MTDDAAAELARAVTGLAAETGGFSAARRDGVRCARCATRLAAGDRVAALVAESRDGWEPVTFRCPDHAPDDLASLTGVHGDDQALVDATLEPTGTHDPRSGFDPDGLTLGAVDVREIARGPDRGPSRRER